MAVPRNERWQTGAVAARTLLALFVIFGLVVFFLPTTPLGSQGAQAQTTPSPAGTAPNIEFLNPSGTTANSGTSGPGREASIADDGSGQGYHLVAWVANIPSGATVEFKYQGTGSTDVEERIGDGILRGTDTFDIFWNLGTLADGTYNVKAILYSNGREVDRDTEPVVINNADATKNAASVQQSEDRGETLEITYPTQAGPWGAFRKPGTNGPYSGVVRVQSSAGTTEVRAYYTTSAPGTEPSWTRCSSPEAGETRANSLDGVKCTLAAGVNPTSVTAIAAAAGDANQSFPATCATATQPNSAPPCGEGEDSGDAHRAMGYVQVPTSVTLNPGTQTVSDDPNTADTQFKCSAEILATVFDQVNAPVVGANVDIHAAGPTDQLYFDDPDTTRPTQPPNSNNHAVENSANCEDTGTPPPALNSTAGQGQGEHEIQGEGDVKHVETTAVGTNDAGQVGFQLLNRTSGATVITGTTQVTAWYDRDDDDAQCSAEPRGHASIGWGTNPASPTGLPDDTSVCSEPSASPTTSSSASASASASSSSSPSASPTTSRSPSSSTSPSQSPQPAGRTITLVASSGNVLYGSSVTLSGNIFSSNASCSDNEFIQINRRLHGTDTFTTFTTTQSDSQGAYEVAFIANESADYQAVSSAHDNCATATSSPTTVLVRVKVSIAVSDARPQFGDRIAFTGKVTPNHSGTKAVLQRRKGGRWVKVAADTLNRRSRYRFVVAAEWRNDRVFRVKWPSTDSDHETNNSARKRVVTHF